MCFFGFLLRNFLTWIFRLFVTEFRLFVTGLRLFVTEHRLFVTEKIFSSSYPYYVQKNFEGLGETENKDYKITYKIIIKYQFLFFEIFDYFLRLK